MSSFKVDAFELIKNKIQTGELEKDRPKWISDEISKNGEAVLVLKEKNDE